MTRQTLSCVGSTHHFRVLGITGLLLCLLWSFYRVQRIPGADGCEISSVAWTRAPGDPHWRLFASTLDGSILELCCRQLQAIAVTGALLVKSAACSRNNIILNTQSCVQQCSSIAVIISGITDCWSWFSPCCC
jgi:hypothetical protein